MRIILGMRAQMKEIVLLQTDLALLGSRSAKSNVKIELCSRSVT